MTRAAVFIEKDGSRHFAIARNQDGPWRKVCTGRRPRSAKKVDKRRRPDHEAVTCEECREIMTARALGDAWSHAGAPGPGACQQIRANDAWVGRTLRPCPACSL